MSDVFTENRPLLFSIAYRMLGGVADAEDMVQETFLRWRKQHVGEITSPKAWLVSTITRLSIDQLRSARRQREQYVGVWLPEPLLGEDEASPSPAKIAALTDSLGLAFMHLMEDLAPLERAVFMLREAFDYDYAAIAKIVGKTEDNCRKYFSRAKQHLTQREMREEPANATAERVVEQFLQACVDGNMKSFLAVLTEDAVMYSDGGGKVRSALKPIRTAEFIGRLYLGIRRKSLADAQAKVARVNGKVGAIFRLTDGSSIVAAFAFRGDRIQTVYWVSNPDKLRGLLAAAAGPIRSVDLDSTAHN